MSFATRENSENDGRPVLLYKFFRTGKAWFYTNADQDITFNGDLYRAVAITSDPFTQSGAGADTPYKITIPRSTALAQYLDLLTPTTSVSIHVRRVHMDENTSDGSFTAPSLANAPVCWIGAISGIGRPSTAERTLTCTALSLARGGLRLSWSSTCPRMLYDRGCKVDKAAFAVPIVTATLVVNDGLSVSAPEFDTHPDDWFTGGFLEWESEPGVVERRGIETHNGDTITMFGTTEAIADGDNFTAYPGCSRVPDVCDGKFSNMVNYGGINHLAGRSPFDGNPVF